MTGPSALSLDGRAFPGLPDRTLPLDELRDLILRRRCPQAVRDAVWAELVTRARREGATWTLACAGMALPALASAAGWLASRHRERDVFDIHAEVLTGFLGALPDIDLERPQVLVRLRWAAFRAGLAALAETLNAPIPLPPGFRSTAPRPPFGHPDLVLARAVREGVLTRTEADLIGTTRLEDVPLAKWAAGHGTAAKAAYAARRRAEVRLADYLRRRTRDTDPDDPVAGAVTTELAAPPVVDGARSRSAGSPQSVTAGQDGAAGMCAEGNEEKSGAAVENGAEIRGFGVREENARGTGSSHGGARCA
ncbi:hypothetical protein D7231_35805 [Streptomyces klenkii]|uniref:Uncharacterized protein n=1 Tax=Streptomyces klenkii TaxID=1420899 RepID=A0A3A9ZPI9_9ACTN|nr:hypothetical protein D7231_35805 [Streptomyces klenkii]